MNGGGGGNGLIRRADVDAVRERARLDEIVSEHVTLRTAGIGSQKGLCPFHDEKTPSFHVRPMLGNWHCFGCGEGGDVISFVQKINHLTFVEAVEMLASRYGVQLHYEKGSGGGGPRTDFGTRQRLIDLHRVAEEFYRDQLETEAAQVGRRFLQERGFDRAAAEHFGVGFAPEGWDALMKHLRGRGFTEPELLASGVVSQGQRGVYDRFRGRLIWPIRDVTGATIGFGARKLLENDPGPKYLNTPESPIYKKSQVLYGLDLARKNIAAKHQVVVMEGYTDVMAAHMAGIDTAVASCGTAFGPEHIKIVRRIMGDTSRTAGLRLGGDLASLGAEVIFTFDGDAAGQKAALRAFEEDQRFVAQTYVAVEESGLDPCDLRLQKGDDALRALVTSRRPLFEFAIKSVLAHVDVNTVEGQVAGLRMAAPVVAQIRDRAMRPEYARRLAGWLGMDERTVLRAVHDAAKRGPEPARESLQAQPSAPGEGEADGAEMLPRTCLSDVVSPRDPVGIVESQSLAMMLQYPERLNATMLELLPEDSFHVPALQGVWDVLQATGILLEAAEQEGLAPVLLDTALEIAGETVRPLVRELAAIELPARNEAELDRLGDSLMRRLTELSFTREYTVLRKRLKQIEPGSEDYAQTMARMTALQERRRSLRAGDE
ncbi:DNA primase [Dermabacteraceae bacterium P13128]